MDNKIEEYKRYEFTRNQLLNNKLCLKFCVCFFGVTSRSLDLTYKSINDNILDVISNHNIKIDIYVHNMRVKKIVSDTKNGERNIVVKDKTKYLQYLKCDNLIYSETNQADFDSNFNWDKTTKYGLYSQYNLNTHKNAIRQLYSVKKVTEMWQTNGESYDYYIYLRPDLLYINKIDIKAILGTFMHDNTLQTPYWHKWTGFNDRIYMGCEHEISINGNRFDYIDEYIEKEKVYHPEKFMKYINSKNNIKHVDIDLKGKRVRRNKQIVNEDFSK